MALFSVSRLFSVCLLQFGITSEIFAANGDGYYQYNTDALPAEKSLYFSTVTQVEFLSNSKTDQRQRRYVPDPIAQLADNYHASQKTKFLISPNSESIQEPPQPPSQSVETIKPDLPVTDSPPTISNVASAQIPAVVPEQEKSSVHNKLSHTFPNASSIVSADFAQGSDGAKSLGPADDDDIAISKFSEELINNTQSQNNITKKTEDHHLYYNSSIIVDSIVSQSYWVDMTKRDDVKINRLLSKSHRRAATVKLSFDFPFYGHVVRNVTIATGGFLYTGEYVHSWLAATQYIAPLMANFDTSISNDSYIKYIDNGTAFTVQWEKVVLQDKPNSGKFTFQATLYSNGDIVFVYQNVPVVIESIQDDQHPVKVGISDAYIIDRTIFFVRRHRVHFKKEEIKNWTVIYLLYQHVLI